MSRQKIYDGIDNDPTGAMNPTGNIIRDAWVFGILSENETCAGWSEMELNQLYEKVFEAWQPYAHLVSRLPPELQDRHRRIYDEAIRVAREKGWNPEVLDSDD